MVAVLSNAGAQVPVMPSNEVAGKVMAGAPLQIADIGSNAGVIVGITVTVNTAVVAHWPAVGVKV